jgi:rubrerythrin
MKNRFLPALIAACAISTSAIAASASAETLKNLNTAFRDESNASHRYQVFAEKAAAEGHSQVAKLFRAASAAEAIHRDTHQATIKKLGGRVDLFTLDSVTPATTAENLAEAIKGESYERDTMYPGFLATAKAEDNRDAERAFHFALAAEKEHAALYVQALAQLGKNPAVDYYVCPVCGNTTAGRPSTEKCDTCRKPTEDFKLIR